VENESHHHTYKIVNGRIRPMLGQRKVLSVRTVLNKVLFIIMSMSFFCFLMGNRIHHYSCVYKHRVGVLKRMGKFNEILNFLHLSFQ
jgi:hypothetical protein